MMKIEVRGAAAECVQPVLLTAGMVGAQVEFRFDEAWEGLSRCAVFTDGLETRDVLLEGTVCTIPHEVLTTVGRVLCVGVYGADTEGNVVIPTVYAQCGMVRPGADPCGDESYLPTPDVTAQLMERMAQLEAGSGGALALDTTLSVEGKAADAKAVGDALAALEAGGALPAPAAAEVGQFITVVAVDEEGKVTATEAVTVPHAEEASF